MTYFSNKNLPPKNKEEAYTIKITKRRSELINVLVGLAFKNNEMIDEKVVNFHTYLRNKKLNGEGNYVKDFIELLSEILENDKKRGWATSIEPKEKTKD